MTTTKTPFVVEQGGIVRDRASGFRIGYVYADKPRHWFYLAAHGVRVTLSDHDTRTNGYAMTKRSAADTLHRAWLRSREEVPR